MVHSNLNIIQVEGEMLRNPAWHGIYLQGKRMYQS